MDSSQQNDLTEKGAAGPRSLMRILGLFETLADASEGLSLADLSTMLATPKSSLLLLLRPLVAEGYLIHADKRYKLGARIFRLAAHVLAAHKLRGFIQPFLNDLARRTQETVYFAVLDKDAKVAVCVEVVDSPNPIRYTVPIGLTMPLYCTAAGNVLLTFSDSAWREEYLRSTALMPMTAETITDVGALRDHLATVERDGVAVSLGRMTLGSAAIAAPVFTADDKLMGALAVAAPADRLGDRLEAVVAATCETAALASGRHPVKSKAKSR